MLRNITRRIGQTTNRRRETNLLFIRASYSTIRDEQPDTNTNSNATTTLDYDVKAERKQTKKDMRGLSDQFRIPPEVGIDDEYYIRGLEEHLKYMSNQPESSDESFSLEFQQFESTTLADSPPGHGEKDHSKHTHHRKRHPTAESSSIPSGSLISNTTKDTTKDTSIDED